MELDPDARRLLELTRAARTPSADDKLRVERALARSLGLAAFSAVAGAASSASAKPLAAALPLKWALGLAVPVLAAAGAVGYFHSRAPQAVTSQSDTRAPIVAPAPAPPEPPTPQETSAPTAVEAPAPAPERAEAPSPRRTTPSEKPKTTETLDAELDLLHDAQAKWRNRDPNGALALLAEHRKRYPKSELRLEREALRVLSLCAAGRTAEAREVADRAFKNAPRSPLRASVEESCVKQ
jgi:outer membrane biosynthesis protein TonB